MKIAYLEGTGSARAAEHDWYTGKGRIYHRGQKFF